MADKPVASTSTQTASASAPVSGNQSSDAAEPVTEQDQLARFLLEKPLWLSALLFFGLGILLAFTPCVFPMIPILSGIIIGHGEKISTGKAFELSLVYVLSMAITYTVAGVVAGLFGANLQAAFQDPWVVSTFVIIFIALSFSMFGFYELQMPTAIQSRLTEISNSQKSGTLAGVAVMGFLSALIVGPCVTAPLIGALIVIGQTGDALLGGTALFALSMGMGAPLLVIGSSAGKLLPKAGPWMDTIKAVFGVGLLVVALWLLERIIPGPVGLFLWAVLFIVSGVYMGALDSLQPGVSGWHKLWKGIGIVLVIWGVLMVIGASTGSRDMLNPLKNMNTGPVAGGTAAQSHLNFTRIKTVDDFNKQLAEANALGQYVMLDFYADWCVYCIQMEERTFPDPGVQKALANVHLLQADVTANDDLDQALLKNFGLIAPPAILFFTPQGEERKNYRVIGFKSAEDFKAHLSKVLR
jgi:thiol:disulfide interchange protein DsbD